MFGIKELKEKLAEAKHKAEYWEKNYYEGKKEFSSTIDTMRKECEDKIARKNREMEIAEDDRKLEIKRDELATANKIAEATAKLVEENRNLQIKLGQIETENKIMEKAFDSMGFDVKDSKEMIDQLIKGLVSKNEIKLIGANK